MVHPQAMYSAAEAAICLVTIRVVVEARIRLPQCHHERACGLLRLEVRQDRLQTSLVVSVPDRIPPHGSPCFLPRRGRYVVVNRCLGVAVVLAMKTVSMVPA